jgi:hypothetical protein
MDLWTLDQIKTKVMDDLDLHEETFISDSELTAYVNEAIDAAEQEIVKIDEDYFLTYEYLALALGVQVIDFPTGIYASKVRGIVYSNGSERYRIRKIRRRAEFEELDEISATGSAEWYRYIIKNDLATGQKIVLYPAARETSSSNVKLWHIRNAKKLASGSDACDLPECINFILAHVKQSCWAKEFMGNPPQFAVAETEKQCKLMVETLTEREPDGDNEIEADFSHYNEHN